MSEKELEALKAEVWKTLAEASILSKENSKQIKLQDEQIKLHGEQIKLQGEQIKLQGEQLRQYIARTDEELKAHKERMDKMDEEHKLFRAELSSFKEELANNTRLLGKIANKLGGIVESAVMPGLVDKFNEKGFCFDSICTNVEFLNEEKDGNLTEVDALLENGKFVIAVEAKTDMSVGDVNAHVKRMKVLRGIPRFKGKKIYGALATAVARKRPMDYALEQGFFVLRQPDVMRVEIMDFPKGRSAKAY